MSVLVIQVPPRPRLASRSAAEPVRPASEYGHVFSADGRTVSSIGRSSSAASLPAADSLVAVLADADVSWHRITVPKAPPARQRAALAGLMEEVLLDDEEALHFALPPQHAAGEPAWVAVVHKPWLVATLAELEASGRVVERVVPASAPGGASWGHFFREGAVDSGAPTLSLVHADGAVVLRASGSLARALLPAEPSSVRWTAVPAAAAAAEQWLDGRVEVLGEAERALESARSAWNLRQFDLLPRHRGTRALRETARRLLSPEWRPVRWGAAALVLVQVLGLNAWAFQQQRAIEEKRAAMTELLRSAHPGVRAVLDPAAQMRRETERLRTAAGRAGDSDLEVLLGAAATAWPDGQGPVQTLRFEGGRLTLAAPGWGEPQMAQFRERLRPTGYTAEMADGRVTVAHAARRPV